MFRPRARVLVYRRTTNIGDAIQTVAMARLLGGTCAGVYRDSPIPDLYLDVPFVVSGWLGWGSPVDGGNCIFAGVHLGHREPDYVRWIRESGRPVGTRDEYTKRLLACNNVSSEAIGCATLTFPRYTGPRRGRLSVDVEPVEGTQLETSVIPNLSWADQWGLALHRLDQLRKAEIVYTRRLHAILPCLAFGTPVVFPFREFRDLFDKTRLSLLHDIGFLFDQPVEMDVGPIAERFVRFLETALEAPLRPVEAPCMPVPVMAPAIEGAPSPAARPVEPSRDAARQPSLTARPRVSTLVVTRDGASRLPACLASIQESGFAEDVVVCVDSRTTDESVAVARSFTQHVHLVRGGHIEMVESRLASLCPGDFVLRVDDDERLGGDWDKKYFEFLVRCNDITHFWTPCRWVVPPGDQFIASPPWFPDLHMRLYLNNPLIISCPNRIHECLRVEGRPLVLYDRWIEHLNLVLSPRAEREAKCRRYLSLRPDHDLSLYYLYEDQSVELMPLTTSPLTAAEIMSKDLKPFRPLVIYQPGSDLLFRSDGNAHGYLLDGWNSPESWGAWTLDHEAGLCLPLEESMGRGATLTAVVQPFVNAKHPVSSVQVLYFGQRIAEWTFESSAQVEKQIVLSPDLVSSDRSPSFVIRVLNPASPIELGDSTDPRRLGLGFVSLRLTPT